MSADTVSGTTGGRRWVDALGGLALAVALAAVFALDRGTSRSLGESRALFERDPRAAVASNDPLAAIVAPMAGGTPDRIPEAPSESVTQDARADSAVPEDAGGQQSAGRQQTEKDVSGQQAVGQQRVGQQPSGQQVSGQQTVPRPSNQKVTPQEPVVKFYEVETKAKTVAFVVDCSSSMGSGQGSPFSIARAELARSILDLQPNQAMFVAFFSSGYVPLFRDGRAPSLYKATPVVKADLFQAIMEFSPGGGTNPEPALQAAAALKPDVVYLLSDGEFAPLGVDTNNLIRNNGIEVHTISLAPSGSAILKQISDAHRGTYRVAAAGGAAIDLTELLAELSADLIHQLSTTAGADRLAVRGALKRLAGGKLDPGPRPGASDKEVQTAMAAWFRWLGDRLGPLYAGKSSDELAELIRSDDAGRRWAALLVARRKGLDIPDVYADLLDSDDPATVQEARAGLAGLAKRHDFGPLPADADDQRALAVRKWRKWIACRKILAELASRSDAEILATTHDADAERRWAAVLSISSKKLKASARLLELLRDADEEVRREAAQILAIAASGADLGPRLVDSPPRFIPDALVDILENADPAADAAAIATVRGSLSDMAVRSLANSPRGANAVPPADATAADWRAWWVREKEVRAEKPFELAKKLHDTLMKDREKRKDTEKKDAGKDAKDAKEADDVGTGKPVVVGGRIISGSSKLTPREKEFQAQQEKAKEKLRAGSRDRRNERLREVIEGYPGTAAAAQAKALLDEAP